MSEIKGQLLGIVLVLMVFGAVSATVAGIFATTRDTISMKANNITKDAETALE